MSSCLAKSPCLLVKKYMTLILFLCCRERSLVSDESWIRKGSFKVVIDDDDEFFLWYGWPTKGVSPYFQPGPLSEILTIANLQHAASRVWTCTEPEFRLSWMKLCSSDNHYTLAPRQCACMPMWHPSSFCEIWGVCVLWITYNHLYNHI